MVAITHRDADRFISEFTQQIDVFVIFGTDAGLIAERTSGILKRIGLNPRNPDQVQKLDGDEIAANPGSLQEHSHAAGLFAEKRAIILRTGSKQIIAPLEVAIREPAVDCPILVQAGALKKDAPLRNLAANAKNAVSIECYPDSPKDIQHLVENAAKEAQLVIDPGTRQLLIGLLGDDRLTTRSELTKLFLYCNDRGRITEADILAIVSDASAFASDNVVLAAFSGDLSFCGDVSSHIYTTSSEAHALVAAAVRHCHLLMQIRADIETGQTFESAANRGGGRLFFGPKQALLKAQVQSWRTSALAQGIDELNQSVLTMRQEPHLANATIMHALLLIARKYNQLKNQRR